MCWTQPYTRHRTTTNKTNNTTLCVGHNHTQDTDDDKQDKYHNTICVGHNHTQDTGRRQKRQITQHYMCWTQPYTIHKMTTNKTNTTTLYELNTTIHKTQDDNKQDI